MSSLEQGRVVELPNATAAQRKALSRVISVIKPARVMTFEKIYAAAVGSMEGYGLDDESNLQKGSIAQWKAAKLFRWIVENHLPLGCQIAPEVFDPSLLTRWRDFIREHGIYDRLTFHLPEDGALGLTQRSRKIPIAEQAIPMAKPFLFDLECGLAGQLLTLEAKGDGKTYPFSLHANQTSVVIDINAGQQTLPILPDGTLDPLSEIEDDGLRSYAFIIAVPEIIQAISKGLREAHPVSLDKLDQIALAFKDIDPSGFEVHRLNVLFK